MKLYSIHKLLIASYGIATFSEGVLMPIYAIFVQRIGGDILEASGAISIFLFVSGLTTVLIHRSNWSQKHRIKLMVYGWLLWVIVDSLQEEGDFLTPTILFSKSVEKKIPFLLE